MANNKLAIIGGSGLYDVEEFTDRKLIQLNTPWGKPSDDILKTKYNNKEVYFLPRHGRGHFISPSNINFRANIDAFKQLGVTDIISVSAVGSLKENLEPGKFVIVDQFIDRTFARNKTFFDEDIVAHVSMAHPTSAGLMISCEDAIKELAPISNYWHCKNLTRINFPEDNRTLFIRENIVGGEIDYRFSVEAMHEANYSGMMAIEGVFTGDQFYSDKLSLDYCKNLWLNLEGE